MSVRTRFAPSPTGYLHLGGARTALFSYLYARHHGGEFVLRVEDTDRERSTDASVQAILDGMRWLGLDYDEGPIFQTHRMDRYREVLDQWLATGKAYRCYATREELDELREKQREAGEKPRYDGRYRDFDGTPPPGVDPCIRFRNPQSGEVSWIDGVHGEVIWQNKELDDLVIARADGTPTYNFTVVVDDIDMAISHVVRGDDHLSNTPRQINLYGAFNQQPPTFAHVPMILGEDGSRLSKRHGAVSVMKYAEEGFLPNALVNYLLRLGWSHGDQELFSRPEMTELFDFDGINKAPASFSPQKLRWVNEQYMQSADGLSVADDLAAQIGALGIQVDDGPEVASVFNAFKDRAATLVEMAEQASFLYQDFDDYEVAAAKKQLRPVAEDALHALRSALGDLDDWSAEAVQKCIESVVEALGVGFGKVGQPLRVAVTGRGGAPGNDVVLSLLGKEKTLARLERAIAFVQERAKNS